MPNEVPHVMFAANGDLIHKGVEGEPVIAHYDRETGYLEFASDKVRAKMYQQIVGAIGSTADGKKTSGLAIKSMSVKGRPIDVPKPGTPPRPRHDPNLGDCTPAVVEWYFKYKPNEAYIRYGVFLDNSGKPVLKDVSRQTIATVDNRELDDGQLKQVPDGNRSTVRGPVTVEKYFTTEKQQMIARRATCMTYTPNEVLGGFSTGDDEDVAEQEVPNE